MVNLKELRTKMKSALKKMEDADLKVSAATDAAVKTAATAEYEGAKSEFDGLKGLIAEAEEHAERHAAMNRIEKLSEPDEGGKSEGVLPQGSPAQARDEGREERDLEGFVADYLCGKSLDAMPEKIHAKFVPRAPKWDEASGGLSLPRHLARLVLPSGIAAEQGKALPLTSVTATGEYVSFPEYKPDLQMIQGPPASLFQRVRRVPTVLGKTIWPRLVQADATDNAFGGVAVTWPGEGAEASDEEPEFEQVTVDAFEVSGYTELSRTLLQRSSLPLETILKDLFGRALAYGIDKTVLTGNGSAKPLGLTNGSSGITSVARQAALKVDYVEDLVNLETAVPPQCRENAVWAISDKAAQYLRKAVDDVGRFYWQPNPVTGKYDTLMGYPVIRNVQFPLGTAGDVILGDPSQYLMPVEQEIVILMSSDYKFKAGLISFRAFALVGGKVVEPLAFAKLGNAA